MQLAGRHAAATAAIALLDGDINIDVFLICLLLLLLPMRCSDLAMQSELEGGVEVDCVSSMVRGR